jgi:CheY-like chemotaxis protein
VAKLLFLDDEEDTLAWMTAALETRGHEVRGALSGRAALKVLEDWCPDLIISDILMPEIDGLTFARLVQQCQGVPVMFVSIAKKQAEAILCGAVGYVQKPATAAEVRDAVERVLGRGAKRNTILIVDDDPDIRDLHRLFLEPRFVVLEAENGLVALDVLRTRTVDLAIVDVHMPVMNGVELIRAIRADSALQRLPIIVQTSDKTAMDTPVWRDLHVSQVVSKHDFLTWLSERIQTRMKAKVSKIR